MIKFLLNLFLASGLVAVAVAEWAIRLALAVSFLTLALVTLPLMILNAAEMWKIMKALIRLAGIQLIGYKTFQLGSEPDDPRAKRLHGQDKVYLEVITTKEEFFALREAANTAGLWFGYFAWSPLGKIIGKFVYEVWVVNKR